MLKKLLKSLLLIHLPFLVYSQQFLDISSQVNIRHSSVDDFLRMVGGVVVFDYNNDHLPDIFLPAGNTDHKLFENHGDFQFEDVSDFCGISEILAESSGANTADLNNDGWEDLFITTREGFPNIVLINNQDGTFTDMAKQYGFDQGNYWGSSVAFADFNRDGILDVYVGNYADYNIDGNKWDLQGPFPNQLFLSQGNFTWKEVAAEFGVQGAGHTLVTQVMDFDLDGDMDIYVGNDFGPVNNNQGNIYYENVDGQGTFEEKTSQMGLDIHMFAMGIGSGDFDEDGDIDLYLSDLGHNELLENRDGTYVDISDTIIPEGDFVSWNGLFLDGNNNGSLDLFVVNGEIIGDEEEPLQYYEKVNGTYYETRFESFDNPFFGRGMGVADLDMDGDQDLVIHAVTETKSNGTTYLKVLKNTVDNRLDSHFLLVSLEGTTSNRNGLGAILKLHLSGGRTLVRTLEKGGGYMSGNPGIVHFGLHEHEIVELEVTWPTGESVSYNEIPKNSSLLINETSGVSVLWQKEVVTSISPQPEFPNLTAYPSLFNNSIYIKGISPDHYIPAKLTSITGSTWDLSFQSKSNTHVLDLSHLNLRQGMYLMSLGMAREMQTFKLWKYIP